jgi:hypothetical protein
LYVLGSPTCPIAALFGTRGKHLALPGGPTRRLNHFQVAPSLRGVGFARQAFAAFARFALEAGATQLVLGSLSHPKVVDFYRSVGGAAVLAPGWSVSEGLVPILFDAVTLLNLGERADALEDEEQVQP